MIDPVALLLTYHAALEARDYVVIEACLSPDAVYVSQGLGALEGREPIMAALREYFSKHTDHVASDDRVEKVSDTCAKSTWRLTANKIERRGEEYISFDARGLIIEIKVQDA